MEPSVFWPVLSLAFGAVFWFAATQGRRGDMFSPFSIFILLLIAIYAIRPMFMIADGDYGFYGLNIRSGVNKAAFIGFVAIVSAGAGYFIKSIGPGRPPVERVEDAPTPEVEPEPQQRASILRIAYVSLAFVVAATVYTAIRGSGGFSFAQLFEGRNDETRAGVAGLPVFIVAMPAAGAIAVSVARVATERVRRLTPVEVTMFWVVIVVSIVPSLGLGNRRFLVPCVVAALVAVTARNYSKVVTVRQVSAVFLAFLLLAILPFVRSTGARQGDGTLTDAFVQYFSANGALGSLRPFFTSYDTEMFNYVAYLSPRLGNTLEYGWGRGTIGDALLSPIPASLAPFDQWSNVLLTQAFGGGCTSGYCPVPSTVGVLYYDLGFVGVIIGCFVIGRLARRYQSSLLEATGWRLALTVGIAAFMPILVRGNTVNVSWILLNVLVFVIFFLRVGKTAASPPRGSDHLKGLGAAASSKHV